MDDVPPGPTGPGPRRLSLSVVIPVHNGGSDLECCLRRLRETRGSDFEIIVVDDASTDDSAAIAAAFGARVIATPGAVARGPASARNDGARAADSDLIFFLDADVAAHPDAVTKALSRFEAEPGLTALFGSYDDHPTAPGLVSQFRNLLHHFTHQQGEFTVNVRLAQTFWTGCGMIRRTAFLEVGGFDPRLYNRPAIEDIELGYRLTRGGHRIVLARDVLGTHLKRWTLLNVIKTDLFQRGVPWMLLIKRSGVVESDLNVRPAQKICVAATGLAGLALMGAYRFPALLGVVALAPMMILGLNLPFYRFLARKRGIPFAMASLPLHLIYFGCCGLSVVLALAYWHLALKHHRVHPTVPGPMGIGRRRTRIGRASRWLRIRRRTRGIRPRPWQS